jgi:hypothetical protein
MENAYTPSTKDRFPPSPLERHEDNLGADLDTDVIALLEENARLRALVTRLSDLVLRHVVDQN